MRNRRLSIVALVTVLLLASGCQMARAGTRCMPGVSPARDATHVLFCQGGRWRRSLTIQLATTFIVSNTPFRIDPIQPDMEVRVDTAIPTSFRLTALNGTPLRDRVVDFTLALDPTVPESRRGSGQLSATSARTDLQGVAKVEFRAGRTVGSLMLVAVSPGVKDSQLRLVNTPGVVADIVRTSGMTPQTAAVKQPFAQPVGAMAIDQFGNPVPGVALDIARAPDSSLVAPAAVLTDADGKVSFGVTAGEDVFAVSGYPRGYSLIELKHAPSGTKEYFEFIVTPGALVDFVVIAPVRTAPVSTPFSSNILVVPVDAYDNGIAGVTVTFTAISGGGGASGVTAVPSAVSSTTGVIALPVTANAVAGSWALRVTIAGIGNVDIPMTNTP